MKKNIIIFLLAINLQNSFAQGYFLQRAKEVNINNTESNGIVQTIKNEIINFSNIYEDKKVNSCINFKKENININFNIEQEQISFDYSKNSSELKEIRKKNINAKNDTNQTKLQILGLFLEKKFITIQPKGKIYKNNNGKVCFVSNQLNMNIKFTPKIYISREAQMFSCTYSRVVSHEKEHYNIALNALKNSKNEIFNLINSTYNKPIEGLSDEDLKSNIDFINKDLNKKFVNIINNNELGKHDHLDTTENYIKESKFCSDSENALLMEQLN